MQAYGSDSKQNMIPQLCGTMLGWLEHGTALPFDNAMKITKSKCYLTRLTIQYKVHETYK